VYIQVLVEDKIEAGKRILVELPNSGFQIEKAFWYRVPDGFWRLVIGSATVDRIGPLEGYRRLHEILNRLELREALTGSIALLGLSDPSYQNLLRDAKSPGQFGVSPNPYFQFNPFQDAYFYN
jgi:hypothetical protein